tara:strand:+ start:106 stop:1056 length:951 start_codon:yes stop_codon:yes gene_type:complete
LSNNKSVFSYTVYIKLVVTNVFFLLFLTIANANTDERYWTLQSGEKIKAEQLSYDSQSGQVVLLIDDKKEYKLQLDELSPIDQAWIVEWDQIEREMNVLIQTLGGKFEHYTAKEEKYSTDFYVYYPSIYEINKMRPMLLLFNAGGKITRYVKQFIESCERHGIIVVGCGSFRNSDDNPELEDEMRKRFAELLPIIESTVPHDPKRLFMGGNSGGAWRAYHYSAWFDRPWAGIYANAGWLGGMKYYEEQYPAGMRIAMVNGNNDHSTNYYLIPDGKLLESKGNIVAVFSFEGGHQSAPPKSRSKALEWLINENGIYD